MECDSPRFPIIANFTFPDQTATGLLVESIPFYCVKDGCFTYKPSRDILQPYQFATLSTKRSGAAAMPFGPRMDQILVAGGKGKESNILSSTEIVTLSGKVFPGPDLPLPLTSHCLANWNKTHGFMAGGETGHVTFTSMPTSKTFLLDYNTMTWTDGPDLLFPRKMHTCTPIPKWDFDRGVIVTGGSFVIDSIDPTNWMYMDYPELCSSLDNTCVSLNNMRLPTPGFRPFVTTLLDHSFATLTFVNDQEVFGVECDDEFDDGSCPNFSWKKREKQLTYTNRGVALVIPDFMTECRPRNVTEIEDIPMISSCHMGVNYKLFFAGYIVIIVISVMLIALIMKRTMS